MISQYGDLCPTALTDGYQHYYKRMPVIGSLWQHKSNTWRRKRYSNHLMPVQVSSGQGEEFNAAAPSDFFQLLNLDLGATTTDIKQSYRALQRLVHPDLIGECFHAPAFRHMLRQAGLSSAAGHHLWGLICFANDC